MSAGLNSHAPHHQPTSRQANPRSAGENFARQPPRHRPGASGPSGGDRSGDLPEVSGWAISGPGQTFSLVLGDPNPRTHAFDPLPALVDGQGDCHCARQRRLLDDISPGWLDQARWQGWGTKVVGQAGEIALCLTGPKIPNLGIWYILIPVG